jgi:hypothetical protein
MITQNSLQDYLMQVATTQPSWVWLHIILYQTSLRIPPVKFQVMHRSLKLINHLSKLAYGCHFAACCLNDTPFPLNTCRLFIVSKECHWKEPFRLNYVFLRKHAYSFQKEATIRYLSMISVLTKVSNIFTNIQIFN